MDRISKAISRRLLAGDTFCSCGASRQECAEMREQGGKCCDKCIHIRKENNKKWREYQKKQKRDNPLYR